MDPHLEEALHRLEKAYFSFDKQQTPDGKNFGNWIVIGTREHLAVRVTSDRGDILLDLMPRERFTAGPNESDWYNWDVVARALGIDIFPEEDALRSFFDHSWMIDEAFSPYRWDKTAAMLSAVEQEKRRRFMEGPRVPPRVPVHQ